jgi:2-methylisocitrate lyase-like PEP mutase family enzyme
MSTKATNDAAKAFKALHIPGKPLLLANVYDTTSARVIASLPDCKALATASYAVATTNGFQDSDLPLETNLAVVRAIAPIARAAGKPLTVDLQDGYGDRLEEAVRAIIDVGVVGINLEDSDQASAAMMEDDVAVSRVRRALAAAAAAGVPDFVVNARADSHLRGAPLEESIRRGKLYLEAGATTVFIFTTGTFTPENISLMAKELGGRVNIGARLPSPGSAVKPLSTRQLGELGIARVSVGPQIYLKVAEVIKQAAEGIYGSSTA